MKYIQKCLEEADDDWIIVIYTWLPACQKAEPAGYFVIKFLK